MAAALDNSWIVWRSAHLDCLESTKIWDNNKVKIKKHHSQLHDKVEVWFTLKDVLQGNYVGMFNPKRKRKGGEKNMSTKE